MLGLSRTLRNGKTVFSEFMRIERLADGGRQFTARIGTRQGPVAFRMVRLTEAEVVFENPPHDFHSKYSIAKWPGGWQPGSKVGKMAKIGPKNFPTAASKQSSNAGSDLPRKVLESMI